MTACAPATAAVMVHNKLTTDAGSSAAALAAQSAKLKLQKKHKQELLEAALTSPQQRVQSQVCLLSNRCYGWLAYAEASIFTAGVGSSSSRSESRRVWRLTGGWRTISDASGGRANAL
jgi:hypothetical protein